MLKLGGTLQQHATQTFLGFMRQIFGVSPRHFWSRSISLEILLIAGQDSTTDLEEQTTWVFLFVFSSSCFLLMFSSFCVPFLSSSADRRRCVRDKFAFGWEGTQDRTGKRDTMCKQTGHERLCGLWVDKCETFSDTQTEN